MSEEYVEISAKTLEDAVKEACQKFSVSSDQLEVEVVDQGSSGFLGFNAKPAVIRVRVKEDSNRADKVQGDVLRETPKEAADEKEDHDEGREAAGDYEADFPAGEADSDETANTESSYEKGSGSHNHRKNSHHSYENVYGAGRDGHKNYVAHSRSTDDFLATGSSDYSRHSHTKHAEEPKVDYTQEQIDAFTKKAVEFLSSMFAAMQMEVQIRTSFDPAENILTIDFEGDDMGVLIGKRGQTLDSIQYLVSLVVNRGIPGYVHVKTDTEDYRERRRRTLESLARNMAAKVKRTRHSCALEPMNPYERRIIHSALQGDRYVTTYSEGEDPYRHVVVTLKK